MVEAAIALPIAFLIIFGSLEFGLAFKTFLATANMAKGGARIASAQGDHPLSDQRILKEVLKSGAGLNRKNIIDVTIFRAEDDDGKMHGGCDSGPPGGFCNKYTLAKLNQLDQPTASSRFGGTPGKWDANWPPKSRDVSNDPLTSTDRIGVRVRTRHDFITKMFANTKKFDETSTMYIEPLRYE